MSNSRGVTGDDVLDRMKQMKADHGNSSEFETTYALLMAEAKVAELKRAAIAASHAADIVDQIHDERLAKLDAAEAQLTALPKWAQSSESKGQFYRKSIQEMAAIREQLAALRERLGELCAKWSSSRAHTYASENADRYRGFDDGQLVCAQELGSLLTKTTPNRATASDNGKVVAKNSPRG